MLALFATAGYLLRDNKRDRFYAESVRWRLISPLPAISEISWLQAREVEGAIMICKGGILLAFGLLPTQFEVQMPTDADSTHTLWFGESLSGIMREYCGAASKMMLEPFGEFPRSLHAPCVRVFG